MIKLPTNSNYRLILVSAFLFIVCGTALVVGTSYDEPKTVNTEPTNVTMKTAPKNDEEFNSLIRLANQEAARNNHFSEKIVAETKADIRVLKSTVDAKERHIQALDHDLNEARKSLKMLQDTVMVVHPDTTEAQHNTMTRRKNLLERVRDNIKGQ